MTKAEELINAKLNEVKVDEAKKTLSISVKLPVEYDQYDDELEATISMSDFEKKVEAGLKKMFPGFAISGSPSFDDLSYELDKD